MGSSVSPRQVILPIRIGRVHQVEGTGVGRRLVATGRRRTGRARPDEVLNAPSVALPDGLSMAADIRLSGVLPDPDALRVGVVCPPWLHVGRHGGEQRMVVAVGGHDADPPKERRRR
jgi:hypothetical protein